MKIKIASIIFILILALSFSLKANAACCVGNPCLAPDPALNSCPNGLAPEASDCNQIEACKSTTTTPSTSSTTTTTFPNPLGFTSVQDMLNRVLSNLMGLILIVAVIFIVLGGFMYMLSGGNEEMVTRAKKTWTGAIIGLAIALAAPTFLKEIQNLLGGSASTNTQTWINNALSIKDIASNVLRWLLSIVGFVAVISLIVGGFMYLTAYGDDERIQKAKKIITYAIIGIIVSLAALVIVRQVQNLLGAQI